MNSTSELNKDKRDSNKIEIKGIFKNIKSKYIFVKIFKNLSKKRILDIIKYKKNIQKRMGVGINGYKEYSENYSSIEIEIIPVNNKYSKFIKIKEEDKKYYHIYFNNNKEEIKRNYLSENLKIKMIKIILDYQVNSLKGLFNNCKCVESINFKRFCRNNINNMDSMFFGCSSLKELNLSDFNTQNVNNCNYMF